MKNDDNTSFLIGITGAFGSGKTTASNFLESLGFKKIILSDFIESEAKKQGHTKITRRVLQNIGNELREKHGSGVLAKKALELANSSNKKVVIDGIRNIGEIEELRNSGNFFLLAVITDRRIRYERLKKLKRREVLTQELFNELDLRDLGINQGKKGLQVATCIALADVFILNNQSEKEFRQILEDTIKNLEKV